MHYIWKLILLLASAALLFWGFLFVRDTYFDGKQTVASTNSVNSALPAEDLLSFQEKNPLPGATLPSALPSSTNTNLQNTAVSNTPLQNTTTNANTSATNTNTPAQNTASSNTSPSNPSSTTPSTPVVKVQTLSPTSSLVGSNLKVSGEVRSVHTSTLISKVNSNVRSVLVKQGDMVKQGDLLVDLTGDASNQALFVQEENLKKQIALQENLVNLQRNTTREQTEITVKNSNTTVSNLYETLLRTQKLNLSSVSSLNLSLRQIDEKILETNKLRELNDQNYEVSFQDVQGTTYGNSRSSLNALWTTLETVAIPLTETLISAGRNVSGLRDNLVKCQKQIKELLYDISDTQIEEDLNDILVNIDQTLLLLNTLIDETNNTSFDGTTRTAISQSVATLTQTIASLQSGYSGLETLERKLDTFGITEAIGLQNIDLQILALKQQKDALLIQKETAQLQQVLQELNVENQLDSAIGNKELVDWNLQNLDKNRNVQIETAKVQVENLKNTLRELQTRVADLRIKAPFDGIISEVITHPGEVVGPNAQLVKIITLENEIKAFVNAKDIQKVAVGTTAKVSLYGDDATFDARVSSLSPVANPQTRNVEVSLQMMTPFIAIPYTLLDVSLPLSSTSTSGIYVPTQSIVFANGAPHIFVYNPQTKTVEERKVVLGKTLGKLVEVVSGVKINEQYISEGQKLLKNGQAVSLGTQ